MKQVWAILAATWCLIFFAEVLSSWWNKTWKILFDVYTWLLTQESRCFSFHSNSVIWTLLPVLSARFIYILIILLRMLMCLVLFFFVIKLHFSKNWFVVQIVTDLVMILFSFFGLLYQIFLVFLFFFFILASFLLI